MRIRKSARCLQDDDSTVYDSSAKRSYGIMTGGEVDREWVYMRRLREYAGSIAEFSSARSGRARRVEKHILMYLFL